MYCHVSAVYVNNKTGFEFDVLIYWTFIQLVTTIHKSLSDTLSSSSDWTLTLHNSVVLRCTLLYSFNSDLNYDWLHSQVKVKVKVTLRLTVSQSVSLGVEPHVGLMTRYLLLFDSYSLVFVGCSLWREDASVFCICCWPLQEQSSWGPSPLGLATMFYCLRFETSLFVISYDSQVYGGGIRPRLHTGIFDCILIWFFCYMAYQYPRKRLLNTCIHGNGVSVSKNPSLQKRVCQLVP
jgi:hypothetical protein